MRAHISGICAASARGDFGYAGPNTPSFNRPGRATSPEQRLTRYKAGWGIYTIIYTDDPLVSKLLGRAYGEMVRRPEGLTPPTLPGVETVCEAPRFILPVRLPRFVLDAAPGEAFETRILSTVDVDVGILARDVDPARLGVMVAELGITP